MQVHQIQPKHLNKTRKRVGRGGKRGTYSGKGMKGQKSRAGANFQPIIRELIKRYPKLKGYRYNPKSKHEEVINLSVLESNFNQGEKVSPQVLLKKKIISKIKNRIPEVKILGKGELTKKLIIEGCNLSKMVKEKVEKNKGKIIT